MMTISPDYRAPKLLLAVATTVSLSLGACAGDSSTESGAVTTSATTSTPTTPAAATTATTSTPAPTSSDSADEPSTSVESDLTDVDIAGLLWMREEEQLAHDVYVVLGELWGLRIFENIAGSETSHIEAALGLLDRYGIADPAAGNEPGTFTDPALQDLYDRLIADGAESLEAALRVGAFIEELDIDDLQVRSAASEVDDVIAVYADLERGSRNHLRAFVSQLEQRGLTYEPTQLDPATFESIVSSETERGRDA